MDRLSILLLLFLLAILPSGVADDISAVTDEGNKVILHDTGTWEYVEPEIEIDELKEQIEITILESKVYTSWVDEKQAGFRLKIKNNSDFPIHELKIRVLFIDKTGKPFFEEERTPVGGYSLFSDYPDVLKPNYSFLYPEEGKYNSVDKLDVTEWDEGKIRIEILEVKTEP